MLIVMVLAGCTLFLGHHFFTAQSLDNDNSLLYENQGAADSLLDERGRIFDRNFKELAVTLDKVSVYANVRDVNVEDVAARLSPVLDVDADYIKSAIEKEAYKAWIAKNISREEEQAIAELRLKGVFFNREKTRFYPQKETASHIIGYVGKSMGLAGVEYHYNSLLNKYGDGLTEEGSVVVQTASPDNSGKYLMLSVDLKIQRILEELIAELAKEQKGSRLAAIMMECNTGKVIGSANFPSYDPNNFHDAGWKDLENILAEPVAIPEAIRSFFWDASLLQSRYERDKEVLPWAVHSVKRSLGSQLRLWDRLGLNDPLDTDFLKQSDEQAGRRPYGIYRDGKNYFDSVAEVATPLHIASAVNSLVTGGEVTAPHAVDSIAGDDGSIFEIRPAKRNEAVSDTTAIEARRLLVSQMDAGPLSSGFLESESVSFTLEGRYRQYETDQMLFAFIPRKDPKLMLFVFAKLPAFSPSPAKTKSRFIMKKAVEKKILPLVMLQEVMSNLSDMMSVEEKEKMNFELQRENSQIGVKAETARDLFYSTMPDLKGFSLRKSLRELKDLQLEIQVSGTGVVVEQLPAAGTQVKAGELCRLVLKPH